MGNLFQRICEKLTKHRIRRGTMWSDGIEPIEFHYKCLLCDKSFWNYTPHRKYYKYVRKLGKNK